MKTLKISGLALLIAAIPSLAVAGDSRMGGPRMGGGKGVPHVGHHRPGGHMGMPKPGGHVGMPRTGGHRNWGGRHNGRWVGGWRAPGGWNAYRRPFVGYALPSYWVNPSFYVGNYGAYGFARPSNGYGWSRYYDDAVMTDRYGRVQDYVESVQWDGNGGGNAGYTEDYSDSYGYRDDGYATYDQPQYGEPESRGRDRDGGLGGAIAGGAIGAVAGTIIGGRNNRTAGGLIGGGLGALGGAAIDSGDRYGRGYKIKKPKRPKYDRRDNRTVYDYGNGGYDRGYGGGYPVRADDRGYEGGYGAQHWGDRGGAPVTVQPQHSPVVVRQGGPSYGYGYGQPEVTTITVQPQPVTTTTTTVTEEIIYTSVAPRRRYVAPRKVWKPRPKPRCVCKVVYR